MSMLYIVSTPIGNREDITLRALRVLKEADLVACEDTRTTGRLLTGYDINVPLTSFHSYTDERKVNSLIAQLKEGKNIALVSEAGTPGISDPGFPLVQKAICAGVHIVPIPGPSAFLAALSVSGFPLHDFHFLGFVPHKKGRETFFKELSQIPETCVFYESTHRIRKACEQLLQFVDQQRPMCIARELTKMHEEIMRGTVAEVCGMIGNKEPRGEYVVVLGPAHFSK